jgi:hypothetical protein
MSLAASRALASSLALWTWAEACASASAPDQGVEDEAYEPTDEEIAAAEAQIQAMFNTVKAVVGTILAVVLGFYGWTFWTSIKCYFAKEDLKRLQAVNSAAVSTPSKAAATPRSQQDRTDSVPAINRHLRPIGPYRLRGAVVKGFGRGSSELGWPTANLEPVAFKGKIDDSEEGVYIGWAQVINSAVRSRTTGASAGAPAVEPVHKALVSVGWNPAYDNKEKTVEAYLCAEFPQDFYGAELRLLVVGYLRPQVRARAVAAFLVSVASGGLMLEQSVIGGVRQMAHRYPHNNTVGTHIT